MFTKRYWKERKRVKEQERKERLEREREEHEEHVRSLSPFKQWLYYSNELGSIENRKDFWLTENGERKLKERFGEKYDQTPPDWDKVTLNLEPRKNEGWKILWEVVKIIGRTWGV